MGDARSTIRVAIIGDVKGLKKALGEGETAVGGFGANAKKIAGGIAFGVAAKEIADFASDALAEADRLGDATTRLELQIGDLAGPLADAAGDFAKLGLSAQDMLELEAAVADAGTALGIANPQIADFADDVSATAAAVALLGDQDAATVVDNINKAAGGATKPLRDLGVVLSDAAVEAAAMQLAGKDTPETLTESELAAGRYAVILEQLKPKLDAVALGSGDVEQRQGELQARFETLTGRIGQGIEGPLNDLLGWILAGIDGLERMDEVMGIVSTAFDDALEHVKPLTDALGDLVGLLFSISTHGLSLDMFAGGGSASGAGAASVNIFLDALNTKDAEQAIVDAFRNKTARSGELT